MSANGPPDLGTVQSEHWSRGPTPIPDRQDQSRRRLQPQSGEVYALFPVLDRPCRWPGSRPTPGHQLTVGDDSVAAGCPAEFVVPRRSPGASGLPRETCNPRVAHPASTCTPWVASIAGQGVHMSEDRIERDTLIEAPLERVW